MSFIVVNLSVYISNRRGDRTIHQYPLSGYHRHTPTSKMFPLTTQKQSDPNRSPNIPQNPPKLRAKFAIRFRHIPQAPLGKNQVFKFGIITKLPGLRRDLNTADLPIIHPLKNPPVRNNLLNNLPVNKPREKLSKGPRRRF